MMAMPHGALTTCGNKIIKIYISVQLPFHIMVMVAAYGPVLLLIGTGMLQMQQFNVNNQIITFKWFSCHIIDMYVYWSFLLYILLLLI